MISSDQYERLKPYKGYILNRTAHGEAGALFTIYSEHGFVPDPGCRVCIGAMFDYFQSVISDYEKENPTDG